MDPRQPIRPTPVRADGSHYSNAMRDPLQRNDSYGSSQQLVPPGGAPPPFSRSMEHSIDVTDHPPRMSESTSGHSRAPLHHGHTSTDYITMPLVKVDSSLPKQEKMGSDYKSAPGGGGGGGSGGHGHGGHGDVKAMEFADSNASTPPQSKRSRACKAIFASNIILRWFVFITPILALLWIPGVVQLFMVPTATIWGVPLIWWSAWLSVWWGGWWVGLAVAKIAPPFLHNTFGILFVGLNKWFNYLYGMQKPITLFSWALLSWIFFNIFIVNHQAAGQTNDRGNGRVIHLMVQFLFGVFLSSVGIVFEKLIIQVIASSFHRISYEDRILEQKAAIRSLAVLYVNSRNVGQTDLDGSLNGSQPNKNSSNILKSALKGVRSVAQAGTTVFGTVASELSGDQALHPNAPQSLVTAALASATKSRMLARRIYYSFVPRDRTELFVADISRFFPDLDSAQNAFKVLDKDENGDASLEEIEMSMLDLHRERLALESSMRDLDSAVGRLDDILMFLFWIIAILVIIALLDVGFQTLLASAGTLILGLSWLIGATAQEVLSSILFLFVKHPYDVADRVDIDTNAYVVKEISLLYTIFRQTDGKIVQIPHSVLNSKNVVNIRRSGPISEKFEFQVDFGTTFEQIEALRLRMLEFVKAEKREFLPSANISIKDFVGQGELTLSCNINYKSNWQNGALKSQRRNKWLCGLKLALAELKIYGPGGAGNPSPAPAGPTEIKLVDTSVPGAISSIIGSLTGHHHHHDQPPPPQQQQQQAATTADYRSNAEVVDHLAFSSRDAALKDSSTDIYGETSGTSSSIPSRDASLGRTATSRQRQQ